MKRIQILKALVLASATSAPVPYQTSNWAEFDGDQCWMINDFGTSASENLVFVAGLATATNAGSLRIQISDACDESDYTYIFRVALSTSTYNLCKQTHAHNTKISRNTINDPTVGAAVS